MGREGGDKRNYQKDRDIRNGDLIPIECGKPECNIHYINPETFIIVSTSLKKKAAIIKDIELVGSMATDYLHPEDVLPYLNKIERVKTKSCNCEYCTYKIENQLFIARFELTENDLIKIIEWNITNFTHDQVFNLKWE